MQPTIIATPTSSVYLATNQFTAAVLRLVAFCCVLIGGILLGVATLEL